MADHLEVSAATLQRLFIPSQKASLYQVLKGKHPQIL